MFVSRETQEKIDKLEAENAELQSKMGELQSSKVSYTPWKGIGIAGIIAFLLASAAAVYFGYFKSNTAAYSEIPIVTQEGLKDWQTLPDSGITYHVQIGAFVEFDLSPYQSDLESVYLFKNDSLQRITLGRFVKFTEAQQFQTKVAQLGLDFAYITAYKDGESVGLMAAIKEERSSP